MGGQSRQRVAAARRSPHAVAGLAQHRQTMPARAYTPRIAHQPDIVLPTFRHSVRALAINAPVAFRALLWGMVALCVWAGTPQITWHAHAGSHTDGPADSHGNDHDHDHDHAHEHGHAGHAVGNESERGAPAATPGTMAIAVGAGVAADSHLHVHDSTPLPQGALMPVGGDSPHAFATGPALQCFPFRQKALRGVHDTPLRPPASAPV